MAEIKKAMGMDGITLGAEVGHSRVWAEKLEKGLSPGVRGP